MAKPKDTISISFGDAEIEVAESRSYNDGVVFKSEKE